MPYGPPEIATRQAKQVCIVGRNKSLELCAQKELKDLKTILTTEIVLYTQQKANHHESHTPTHTLNRCAVQGSRRRYLHKYYSRCQASGPSECCGGHLAGMGSLGSGDWGSEATIACTTCTGVDTELRREPTADRPS